MTDMDRAIAVAAEADARRLAEAYVQAVAAGAANTRCAEDRELGHGSLRLLTLSTLRLPDLALQTYLLDLGRRADVVALDLELDTAWEITAGALRLAHRALKAHAETVGYDPAAWVDRALARARATLTGLESAGIEGAIAVTQDQVHLTAIALTRAAAATVDDAMQAPDEIASALAHLLTLFVIVSEAIDA